MRADAERNRQAILAAARTVFAERGTGAPLDLIAQQAGVGQATLYRRFPTRDDLIRAVIMDAAAHIQQAVREARAPAEDGTPAWERLVRPLAELRLGLLLPTLGAELAAITAADQELHEATREAVWAARDLIAEAQENGSLRPDISLVELQMLLSTVSRPIPGLPPEITDRLGERLVSVVIDGLRASSATPLPGTIVTRTEAGTAVGLPGFFWSDEHPEYTEGREGTEPTEGPGPDDTPQLPPSPTSPP